MSDDATPGFDPRFDPAFQRGFDGSAVSTAPATKPRSATAAGREKATEREKSAGHNEAAGRGGTPAPEESTRPQELNDRGEAATTSGVDANDDTIALPLRRFNPFIVALAVLSILLIVGGLWAAQFARESFLTVNLSTDIDYVTLQMVIFGAPLAVAIGVATGVGVLFILAQRWRRRGR